MEKTKDARAGAAEMRAVARLLARWADELEGAPPPAAEGAAEAPAPGTRRGRKKKASPAPAGDAAAEPAPAEEMTYARVREILGNKSAAGYSAQVQALIHSFGAAKLSGVDPARYPALLEAADRLGGDADAG